MQLLNSLLLTLKSLLKYAKPFHDATLSKLCFYSQCILVKFMPRHGTGSPYTSSIRPSSFTKLCMFDEDYDLNISQWKYFGDMPKWRPRQYYNISAVPPCLTHRYENWHNNITCQQSLLDPLAKSNRKLAILIWSLILGAIFRSHIWTNLLL